MSRCFIAAVLSLLLVAPVLSEERTVALGDLTLNLDGLKNLGEQRYTYRAKSPGSQQVDGRGTVVLGIEFSDDEVVLTDKMELTYRGQKLSLALVHHCRKDNYLSPTKIVSEGEGDDEVATFIATLEDGKATVKAGGRAREIDIPSDTVSSSALMRLLPLLPREDGLRITFPHWLESSEMNLKKDFVIQCLGEESIAAGNGELACTKYRLTSQQITPMDAWVDHDGILQRMLIDRRKVIDLVRE